MQNRISCNLHTSNGLVALELTLCPPSILAHLPSDVLVHLVQGWELAELAAAMGACRAFHTALRELAKSAGAAAARLQRACSKALSARTPCARTSAEARGGPRQRIVRGSFEFKLYLEPIVCVGVDGSIEASFNPAESSGLDGRPEASLDWKHCGLDAADMEAVATALHGRFGSNMNSLQLSGNPIGDAGVCTLAPALVSRVVPQMTQLELEDCGMGDEGAVALAHALGSTGPIVFALRRLCLGSNPIGDAGCEAIAEVLVTPRLLPCDKPHTSNGERLGLMILQLGDTDIGDAGAAALARALDEGAMPRGLQLWLASTHISQAGRRHLMASASRRDGLRVCW